MVGFLGGDLRPGRAGLRRLAGAAGAVPCWADGGSHVCPAESAFCEPAQWQHRGWLHAKRAMREGKAGGEEGCMQGGKLHCTAAVHEQDTGSARAERHRNRSQPLPSHQGMNKMQRMKAMQRMEAMQRMGKTAAARSKKKTKK